MRELASAGAGFLLAVLWFDLMFDVQSRAHRSDAVPADVRDSIAAYYRRVTTSARPMNRLVAVAMLVTIGALVAVVARGDAPRWAASISLALVSGAVGLAAARTVRNAVRLGRQSDPPEQQGALARSILRDHVACFLAVGGALGLLVAVR